VSETPEEFDYDDSGDDCWECGGEGGWNSCMEDTCCAIEAEGAAEVAA
jgi:hypothetical protein